MKRIVIVDYGYGNLGSLTRTLAHIGACPITSADPREVAAAESLIVPGVGAFGDGMAELTGRGLCEPILKAAKEKKPLLGICLGMQFFFERSLEFGEHAGLGIFKGTVRKISIAKKPFCKVPHIGWSALLPSSGASWQGTILDGIPRGKEAYFVHSYAGYAEDSSAILAQTEYCDSIFPSVISAGTTVGVQFHPEKSAEMGIHILRNFASW
jgi:glutamine amidotransferase